MMILHNPTNGATIKDLYYQSVLYFAVKDNEEFKPGDIIEVEDEVAKFVLSLYQFVEEVSEKKAAILVKEKESQMKCEQCEYRTESEESLKMHVATHKSKATIKSKLGLKVIEKREKEVKKKETEDEFDRQNEIEEENKRDGLIGDGLIKERLGED